MQVSFDFMNQQLIWQGFSVRRFALRWFGVVRIQLLTCTCSFCSHVCAQEFMLFILPLINFDRIRGLFRRVFRADSPDSADATGCVAPPSSLHL